VRGVWQWEPRVPLLRKVAPGDWVHKARQRQEGFFSQLIPWRAAKS
jgi:hypothetical protein